MTVLSYCVLGRWCSGIILEDIVVVVVLAVDIVVFSFGFGALVTNAALVVVVCGSSSVTWFLVRFYCYYCY